MSFSDRMRRAYSSSRAPAGVTAAPLLPRVSSGTPARSSSLRNCSLTDDCDRNRRGAAAERLPLSATVTNVFS
ncbi:hypothetical protein D3C86_1534290 [compost metagenome]